MIRLDVILLLALLPLISAYQSWTYSITETRPGYLSVEACVEHDLLSNCGWRILLNIKRKRVLDLQISDAKIERTWFTKSGNTKYFLDSPESLPSLEANTCLRFNASFNINNVSPHKFNAVIKKVCFNESYYKPGKAPKITTTLAPTTQPTTTQPTTTQPTTSQPTTVQSTTQEENDPDFTFEIWSAQVVERQRSNTEVKVIISSSANYHDLELTENPTCHKIQFQYPEGLEPSSVTARYTKLCDNGEWSTDTPTTPDTQTTQVTTTTSTNSQDPDPEDFRFDLTNEWNRGSEGDMCLYYTETATCGWEGEIVLRGEDLSQLQFYIWSAQVVERQRSNTEVKVIISSSANNHDLELTENPTCHKIQFQYEEGLKPSYVAGHFTKVCHDGEWNTNPNVPGPTTTSSTSTTTETTTRPTTETTTRPTTETTTRPTTETTSRPTTETTSRQTNPTTDSTTSLSTARPTTTEQTESTTTTRPTTPEPTTSTGPTETTTSPPLEDDSYEEALQKSMLFYMAQRSGHISDDLVPWRGDSALTDQGDDGRDLTGGWYDAGDNVKFGFPMAGSATNLIWGFLKWRTGYQMANREEMMYKLIKHPLDYFLKCWDNENQEFYGQVGNGGADHAQWWRPEDIDAKVESNQHNRPAYKITRQSPGSDLAGETAAALAAGSIAFQNKDPVYSTQLLTAAKQLFEFAKNYPGKYSDSISDAATFYRSWSGYNDELAWAAAWLHQATNDVEYLNYAEVKVNSMSDSDWFSWDNKAPGVYTLLYMITNKDSYKTKVENFMNYWTGQATSGPCGIAWVSEWGPLRYSANAALIALMAAEEDLHTTSYTNFAKDQIDAMLGKCGRSYVVGFGQNSPKRPHHRASSCPTDKTLTCGWDNYNANIDNPNQLTGALVGGPDRDGNFRDDRTDFKLNEVTTDYNAGFQGALAGLIERGYTPSLP